MTIRIVYPDPGKLRARKVVTPSKFTTKGKYPSWKMQRMMEHESPYEKYAFMSLDANPSVIRYAEQPCIIHYEMDGIWRKHFPDIEVEFATHQELWEVKVMRDAQDPCVQHRTEFLTQRLAHIGKTYRLVLGEELAAQPRLQNIQKLLAFGNKPVPIIEREIIRQALLNSGGLPWQAFLDNECRETRYHISRLILEGFAAVDLSAPLTGESVVRLVRKDS